MARSLCERSPNAVSRRRTTRTTRRVLKYDSWAASKFADTCQQITRPKTWTRNHPVRVVNWKDDRVWDKIRNEGYYHRSDEIIVSCGTVSIHQAEGPCPKILVVYNKKIGIHQLPKGRKDFGESHLDTALRETTEETGVAVRPLRLRFGSRSTVPRSPHSAVEKACGVEDLSTGITKGLSNEMIGVNPDPATGAWRNIHWYAAKPRGAIGRDDGNMPLQEDRDKFSTSWFSEAEALDKLKLDDEKFMVRVAFTYLHNMSKEDWLSNAELEQQQDGGMNLASDRDDQTTSAPEI
ncbi:NUDIX hydrolase domain-like protein [Xylariaceae sp. FL1272]|nr:NUDIX hydrolase domain-like protein [Xylariaceae sp. FL1272]